MIYYHIISVVVSKYLMNLTYIFYLKGGKKLDFVRTSHNSIERKTYTKGQGNEKYLRNSRPHINIINCLKIQQSKQ